MRIVPLLALILFPVVSPAQDSLMFVAAKTGLNLRETPDVNAKSVEKLSYATAVILQPVTDPPKKVTIEGMTGYWKKVSFNQKTGYLIDAYLLPVRPPLNGTKTMKEFFGQYTEPFGDKLTVSKSPGDRPDEGGSQLIKQLYKNGAEWHEYLGYEYNSMTYFVPGFTMQQTFLLLRLIPEFRDFVGENDEFITRDKKIKKKEREYEYTVEKEVFGDTPWINRVKIGFEDGAIYNFEMYQIDDQVIIFYGSGV